MINERRSVAGVTHQTMNEPNTTLVSNGNRTNYRDVRTQKVYVRHQATFPKTPEFNVSSKRHVKKVKAR